MLFDTPAFLVFFAVVVVAYFNLPPKYRWSWLLAGSIFFYAWAAARYLPLLGSIILIDYFAGIAIERATGRRRLHYLCASLVANLGALAYFKYWNFLGTSFQQLMETLGFHCNVWLISSVIPVGLSFHTFQALAYTIEVYRGNQKAERHLGIYALYVMFFPQMVAGPIERPQNLLHQFREVHEFDYERARSGLRLMAWGLFKKMVVADTLAHVVDVVYGNPLHVTAFSLAAGTVCFAYQIYCDFSGYSDIAIGAARVLGFDLMTNFRRPYHAASLGEFWHRWHISLSTWFRDYVYFPLGGSRGSEDKTDRNLLIVFTLSGIWHGANWTFLIWGLYHGVCRFIERKLTGGKSELLTGWRRAPGVVRTFILVSIGWVFFRANSLTDVINLFSHSLRGFEAFVNFDAMTNQLAELGLQPSDLGWALVLIALVELVQCIQVYWPLPEILNRRAWWMRWSAYYALAILILLFGHYNAPFFIYYKF